MSVVAEYKYFYIVELPKKKGHKKAIYHIYSLGERYSLGVIKWYSRWRQYCFFPDKATTWNSACLQDMRNFLAKLKGEQDEIQPG